MSQSPYITTTPEIKDIYEKQDKLVMEYNGFVYHGEYLKQVLEEMSNFNDFLKKEFPSVKARPPHDTHDDIPQSYFRSTAASFLKDVKPESQESKDFKDSLSLLDRKSEEFNRFLRINKGHNATNKAYASVVLKLKEFVFLELPQEINIKTYSEIGDIMGQLDQKINEFETEKKSNDDLTAKFLTEKEDEFLKLYKELCKILKVDNFTRADFGLYDETKTQIGYMQLYEKYGLFDPDHKTHFPYGRQFPYGYGGRARAVTQKQQLVKKNRSQRSGRKRSGRKRSGRKRSDRKNGRK